MEKVQASALKLDDEDKSLTVICSVPQNLSAGYWVNGPSELAVEDPTDNRSNQGLGLLISALRKVNRDLIARYVWRKNVPPKLVLLSAPRMLLDWPINVNSPDKYDYDLYLHLNYLPFKEDMVAPPDLPNLKNISRVQLDAMNQFVAGAVS